MLREDFIEIIKKLELPFEECSKCGGWSEDYDGIYVFGKDEYTKKHKHPRKYKDLFVPYIRVSNFGGNMYVRDCGYCYYTNDEDLKKKLYRLSIVKERS